MDGGLCEDRRCLEGWVEVGVRRDVYKGGLMDVCRKRERETGVGLASWEAVSEERVDGAGR